MKRKLYTSNKMHHIEGILDGRSQLLFVLSYILEGYQFYILLRSSETNRR